MADKKISALTAATTPLAGTEVLPIVQGGSTVKVAVSDLTAGRTVAVTSLTYTGNIIGGSGGTGAGLAPIYLNGGSGGGGFIQGQQNSTPTWLIGDTSTALGSGTGMIEFIYNSQPKITYLQGTGEIHRTTTVGVAMAAGKGIDFSANGGDVLSQYDEGTWTPTFSGWSSNPVTVAAEYTRIGRQVTLTARFYGGVTAGAGLILGFPFTASASGGGAINASTEGNPTVQISGIVNGSSYYAQNINAVTLTSTYWVFSTTFFI